MLMKKLTCVSCIHTALSQEVSPEVWRNVQLSTIELSITTRNSQLDLTVSVLFLLEKRLASGKSDKGCLLFH